ncbi:hypothetical protein IWQ62_000284 [Dispira parvispora]|uniref:tRNA wybutosine-synthesizing protein 3 n=1 Tax=Dispira parvispora TaxID=1520584 RepID=A0A9W8B1N2_9FUNG|nr:hypothetical protein IWQ62_000284 [Dispira parvispora]
MAAQESSSSPQNTTPANSPPPVEAPTLSTADAIATPPAKDSTLTMLPQERDFIARKPHILADILTQTNDKSPKGSIDEPIQPLLALLNRHPDYVTTSSCSGRVAVYADQPTTTSPITQSAARQAGQWLFVSHEPVNVDQYTTSQSLRRLFLGPLAVDSSVVPNSPQLANPSNGMGIAGLVSFKFEPLIIHVQSRTLTAAQRLLTLVRGCGLQNSGLTISAKRYIVAIRSALRLDVPIALVFPPTLSSASPSPVQMLVDEHYLRLLLTLGNQKFTENLDVTTRIQSTLHSALYTENGSPCLSTDGNYPEQLQGDDKQSIPQRIETKEERRQRKREEGLARQRQLLLDQEKPC